MKGVAAAVAVVAAVLLVASAAAHGSKAAGPVACYRAAGWHVRHGSTEHGGSASLARFTYAGWLDIGWQPGGRFLFDTSGNLTAAQLAVVHECSPGVPVPDVAP